MQHPSSLPPSLLSFTQVGSEHLLQNEHQLLRWVFSGHESCRTNFPQDGDLPPAQAAVWRPLDSGGSQDTSSQVGVCASVCFDFVNYACSRSECSGMEAYFESLYQVSLKCKGKCFWFFRWQLIWKLCKLTGLHQTTVRCCDLITPRPFLISTLIWDVGEHSDPLHGGVDIWASSLSGWTEQITWHPPNEERHRVLWIRLSTGAFCEFIQTDSWNRNQNAPRRERKRKSISDWPSWVKWSVLRLPVSMWLRICS